MSTPKIESLTVNEQLARGRILSSSQKHSASHVTFGRAMQWRIWILFLAATLAGPAVFGQKPKTDDYFYANGKKIPVVVLLDRIGAIGKDRVTANEVIRIARPLGLDLTEDLSGGLFILKLPQSTDRAGVVRLAREVRRQGAAVFRDVGFLVQVEGDKTPSVVTDEFIAQFRPNVGKARIDEFNNANGVTIVRQEPFVRNQFLLRVESAASDALRMANRYQESQLVVF